MTLVGAKGERQAIPFLTKASNKRYTEADLLLLICGFDLLDELIDVAGFDLASEFRHAAFSIGDDGAKIVDRSSSGFDRDQGWPAKMPALGGFAVTLGAIFPVDGIRCEGRRVRSMLLSRSAGA